MMVSIVCYETTGQVIVSSFLAFIWVTSERAVGGGLQHESFGRGFSLFQISQWQGISLSGTGGIFCGGRISHDA